MSEIFSRTVLCDDCDDYSQDLKDTGYEVMDCHKDASQPGMCTVRYRYPQALPVATAGKTLAAHSMALAAQHGPAAMPSQAAAAKAIVNLFETGEVLGDYGAVTVLAGDSGHLTYGRSQTTLGSGNLAEMLARYCEQPGARFAGRLQAWLPRLRQRDLSLDHDQQLHNVLRACADDPVMRETQDRFFDQAYWEPAVRAAGKLGITLPLGIAIVYDSWVHGSWNLVRGMADQKGTLAQVGEKAWLANYVQARRDWLAGHSNTLLRKTVYRMDAFARLIDLGQWALALPLVVRGQEISAASLSALPPGCYDGPQPGSRTLSVQTPLQRGLDARLVQLGLSDLGFPVRADGIYGPGTAGTVKALQKSNGLAETGVADPVLIAKLVS